MGIPTKSVIHSINVCHQPTLSRRNNSMLLLEGLSHFNREVILKTQRVWVMGEIHLNDLGYYSMA